MSLSYKPEEGTKEHEVFESLRNVLDPEIGLSIVELGLIRAIEVQPDRLNLTMIMTTPFCPYGPALIEQTRQTAQAAAGLPTKIELGMEMWDPSMMEEGAGADWGLF
jgi:metal-sulfur cluster biosynthetic enzyme